MNLGALDLISAYLVVGDWSGVSCFNINITRNERSIDYPGFPVRMKQVLLRELEWFRRLGALRHWVHDVLIFNTGSASSI